ncbi:MAG: mltG [Clostridia bacterium]|jgi:UPF0755 protein|nr:mltG [Clostridia bacterium]
MKKRKVINNVFRFTIFIIVLVVAATILGYQYYNSNLAAAAPNGTEQEITIAKGSSVKAISSQLENQGIIKNANVFSIYCKLSDKASKIKAGKYILSSAMSVEQIVNKLAAGNAETNSARFTIPEGFELRQIADRLEAQGLINKDEFYAAIEKSDFNYSFIKDIPSREGKLEGYLFPDTYEVFKNATEQEIIDKMLGRFDKVFTAEYRQRAKELNMTFDQVITLASIIEREAKLDKDRKLVSAVFHNRIKKNMKLESCATVQYLLKEQKPVLTYKDLEVNSPYNTYMYAGLPKGPIASPGAKSIEAALYPDDVDFLFFFATKDGSHIFSRTYKEHLAAQNKINQ